MRFGIMHDTCLWELLARQRTWHASPLWITVRKHGKGVALQCLKMHQGGCLRRHGIVLPRRGEPPLDCPTLLLLRPLLLLPLLLLPRAMLLGSLPRLCLPRLSRLRRGRHRSDAMCLTPGGIDVGAAFPPS